jgi:hypothetical protein
VEAILQAVQVAFAVAVFGYLVIRGPGPKYKPWVGFVIAGTFALIGVIVQLTGAALKVHEWRGLVPWLTMERDTIWHGTTSLAFAYGFMAYAIFHVVSGRSRRDG